MQPPGSPRAPWKRHFHIEPRGGAPPMSGTVERGITRSHSELGSQAPPRRKYCGGSPWEDRAFRSWAALFLLRRGAAARGDPAAAPLFFLRLSRRFALSFMLCGTALFPAPGRVAVPCRRLLLDAGLFLPLAIRFLILCCLLVLISFCGFTRSSSAQ